MRRDLAVAHLHDIDGLEMNRPAGGRHAKERSLVGAVVGLERRHPIPVGNLPMDDGMKVGKGGSQRPVEFARACLVGRASRLRRVVEEVLGEKLLKDFEIPAALDLFGVPANDRFRGLARVSDRHRLSPFGLMVLQSRWLEAKRHSYPSSQEARAFWARSCSSHAKATPVPPPCAARSSPTAPAVSSRAQSR